MFTEGEWETIETPSNDTAYAISCPEYDVDIAYIARYDINPPEVKANAHLIAAAPLLYEALKELRSKFRTAAEMAHLSEVLITQELEATNKALAKAENNA